MDKITDKKKLLQQKMNRLKEQEAKIKIMERKQRTRRLIELGGLVDKAGLSDLNSAQLFGALLSIKAQSKNPMLLDQWSKVGEEAFKEKSVMENEKPITIKFVSEPDNDIRKKLRAFGMRWNSVRKEWEGVADPHKIKETIHDVQMTIQEILAA
jgi:hypothetical protein